MNPIVAIRILAALRAAYGAIMTVATPTVLRRMVPAEETSGALTLFARTLGIRNFVFGLGCLLATRKNGSEDTRRWVGAWLASDFADIVAGAMAQGLVGTRGAAIAAAVPVPFAASGIWALQRLRRAYPVNTARQSHFPGWPPNSRLEPTAVAPASRISTTEEDDGWSTAKQRPTRWLVP